MTTIAVEEFQDHVRRYLDAVRGGEEVVLTEGGKPVARIVKEPEEDEADRQVLEKLAARGLVELPTREPNRNPPPPMKLPGKPLSEIIIEDREDRV